MWTGGLTLEKRSGLHLIPVLAPLLFVVDGSWIGHHTLTTIADFWFLYLASWWVTISLNAYLRRSQQDLRDAAGRQTLGTPVRATVNAAVRAARLHEVECQLPTASTDSIAAPLSSELLMLVRRRSLRRQFTEWRARAVTVEGASLSRANHRGLANWIDLYLATEPSPLSLRLTTRRGILHLSTKAVHSALTQEDLPEVEGGSAIIESTGFGRVVSLELPSTYVRGHVSTVPSDGLRGQLNVPYLNDVVGGGVAGDNYRFGRTLIWIMSLYPLSVVVQQLFLRHPPGRPDHSPIWLRAVAYGLLSVVGLIAVVSVRKKEAVTTRRSWLWSLMTAYAAVVLGFASLDPTGSFWSNPNGSRRFLHPFFGYGLLLSLLLTLWLAHTPLPLAQRWYDPRKMSPQRRRLTLPVRHGVTTIAAAMTTVLPVIAAIAIAGTRLPGFTVRHFVYQSALWIGPSIVAAVVAYFVLRPLFDVVSEEAFAFQAGVGIGAPHVEVDSHLRTCAPGCPLRGRVEELASHWQQPNSLVPLAASLLSGTLQVNAQSFASRSYTIETPLTASALLEAAGTLDRVLILEGLSPSEVNADNARAAVVRFQSATVDPANRLLRHVLLRDKSWVRVRDRWIAAMPLDR